MTEIATTGRLFGPAFHRVPDEIVMKRLRQDLHVHLGGDWWALVLFTDGRWVSRGAKDGARPPKVETMILLQRIAVALNTQAAQDGHWVVALVPSGEVHALWRDGDGDAHAVLEFDEKGPRLHGWTGDQFAGQAEASLNLYRAQHAKVEAAPGQMIRRTLGEAPTRH